MMGLAGLALRYYWTSVCADCAMKGQCTPSKKRRVSRQLTPLVPSGMGPDGIFRGG